MHSLDAPSFTSATLWPSCSSNLVGFLLDAPSRRPSMLDDLWLPDLRCLYNHSNFPGLVLNKKADPLVNPTAWLTLVQDKGWSSILSLVTDRSLQRVPRAPPQVVRHSVSDMSQVTDSWFVCPSCPAQSRRVFTSSAACRQHKVCVHQLSNQSQSWIAYHHCPSCGKLQSGKSNDGAEER